VAYKVAATIIALYGVLSIVGGIVGYVNANSRASLIAGGLLGAILVLSAIGMNYAPRTALVVGIVTALLIGGRFGSKLATNASKLREFVTSPSGRWPVAMTSGAIIVIAVSAIAMASGGGPQGSAPNPPASRQPGP
jgi:uncharacterized membrane protein (UPF0136 family)